MKNLLGSKLGKDLLYLGLYAVGLASISMMIYTVGGFISIGGWRPFENYYIRDATILIITAAAAGGIGLRIWRRRKSSEQLAEGIGEAAKEEDDGVVLKDKMKDALATLKKAGGGKGDYLYDLPWYVIIGPPGAGKTTALVNSGLKFPLSRGATPAAVAGVGGTRYCDWWFTEDAVLIDTAGRYTTQDSDATSDKKSWFSFLDLLKKNRPRQPINGVIVAISLEDLMTLSSAEIASHSDAIRARLLELHDRLKVDFPVYAVFTKGDLVAGFMEFFGSLGENGRKQVWGATFQTNDKTRNLVGEVPFEFDALIERLNIDLTDRLQEEPAPSTRVALFGFPAQMAALKRPIFDFLNSIFEPTRYHANATLRGFYFTSGTQEGTPIDQVIGALARSFGAEEVAGASYSGKGRSYFLTDLINKVIIGEAAWVSTDWRAVRRALILKVAAYTCILAFAAAAVTAWWISYSHNRDLIAQTDTRIEAYRAAAGPLATEKIISDRALERVEPLLRRLRFLPAGYASRGTPVPLAAKFGLSQYERIQSSSENAYRIALERMFRPRLMFRLEELLEANRNVPGFLYEALKVYLMLGGQQPVDRELVLQWMRRDWADTLYPGAGNAGGRKALEEHLVALLDLEAGNEPLFTLHGPLIEETQKTLARLSVSQRAYELLKSQARSAALPDWVPARNGGQDFALVFGAVGNQDLESVRVPGFFTYAGFQRGFVEQLGDIAEQVKKERWVLGPAGEQTAVQAQYDALGPALLELYTPRLHRGMARHARQAADAPAHHRQAEIPRARGGRRRNLADQAVARVDPRRDRIDARTPRHQAARRAAGRGRHGWCRTRCANAAAPAGPRARRRDRGGIQGLPRAGRGRRNAAPDRRDHREPQRDPSEPDTARNQPVAGRARQRRSADAGREPALEREPAAGALRRHAVARRRHFRRRPDSVVAPAARARARRSGDRRVPADRAEPLSVHARQHAGSPAHRFRPVVRPGRRVRPVLQPASSATRRHLAPRMAMAAGQYARSHALAGDAARIPARRADT